MAYPILFDASKINIRIIYKLKETDENKFLNLFETIFKRKVSGNLIEWFEKPYGKNIWAIADEKDTGRFIGIYGLMPLEFFFKGKEIKGYLCHSVGIIPDYQGKGLFQYIGEYTLTRTVKSQEIVLGFPNLSAFKGHKRIGWSDIGRMNFYVKKEFSCYEETMFANVFEVAQFQEDINEFLTKNKKRFELSVSKNHNFLNWRITNPDQSYKCFIYKKNNIISGYMIFKAYNDRQYNLKKGHIIDIQSDSNEVLQTLIKKAEILSKFMNLNLLNIWVFGDSYLVKEFVNAGFSKEANAFDNPVILYSTDTSVVEQFPKIDKSKILLSLGDNDVY